MVTGADLLVECLAREDVRHVFGIPGAQPLGLVDSIGRAPGIDFVMTRHEQAASHMADAWARVTGGISACLGTVGPGATDLVPGVATAWCDSSPMLVLTAQTQSFRAYPHHGSQQELDQLRLFSPITKFSACVYHVSRIPEMVRAAVRAALSGRQGPAHLDLPADVLFANVEPDAAWMWEPRETRAGGSGGLARSDLEEIVRLLEGARRPLVYLGKGVLRAGAWEEARALAERLGAAVATSVGAKGAIPEDHPQALIAMGYGAMAAQADSDVVLAVGTRFGELSFWGRPPLWGEWDVQKVIQIDADPQIVGMNRPVAVGAVADARAALSEILAALGGAPARAPHPGIAEYRAAQESWLAGFESDSTSDRTPIHPLRLAREVREFFPREAIVVVDGGNCCVWSSYVTRVYDPRSFLWAGNMGHLGAGLPFAVAAKLAHPERPVFVLHGDGSFMFLPQELETARRLGLPIVDVIFNDRAFGMIKGAQDMACGSRHVGVDFFDTRYDELARAMGCHGERVTEPDEIGPALKRAVDAGVPAVLDVIVDQEANLAAPDLATLADLWLEGCGG